MRNALKLKRTYIVAAILAVIGLGIPYGIFGITLLPSVDASPFEYEYLLLIFLVVYILAGYVTWDMTRVRWRRKNKVWDGPIDPEIVDKSWGSSMFFFLASIILLIVVAINEIYALANGVYPFF